MTRTEKQERKQANTIFNEVGQFAYVLGVRERDIIDSKINYNFSLFSRNFQEDFQRDTRGIQFMTALTLIYSQRVRILGNPD